MRKSHARSAVLSKLSGLEFRGGEAATPQGQATVAEARFVCWVVNTQQATDPSKQKAGRMSCRMSLLSSSGSPCARSSGSCFHRVACISRSASAHLLRAEGREIGRAAFYLVVRIGAGSQRDPDARSRGLRKHGQAESRVLLWNARRSEHARLLGTTLHMQSPVEPFVAAMLAIDRPATSKPLRAMIRRLCKRYCA